VPAGHKKAEQKTGAACAFSIWQNLSFDTNNQPEKSKIGLPTTCLTASQTASEAAGGLFWKFLALFKYEKCNLPFLKKRKQLLFFALLFARRGGQPGR
jgi:hypothetical protein